MDVGCGGQEVVSRDIKFDGMLHAIQISACTRLPPVALLQPKLTNDPKKPHGPAL